VGGDALDLARHERDRQFPEELPGGYRCLAVEGEAYWEAFEAELRRHFPPEVYFDSDRMRDPERQAASDRLADAMSGGTLADHWLVRAPDGTLAGAFAGFSALPRRYQQLHSAVHPAHRRRGLYREMTGRLLRYTGALGFDTVESFHAPSNNAILIAKLQLGFRIVGLEVGPAPGWSVRLCYFHSARAAAVYEYRCGLASLSEQAYAATAPYGAAQQLAEQGAAGARAAADRP
jgi:RimJ/RimL family protein N-acetyltransferase